jgi:hypothetical protein
LSHGPSPVISCIARAAFACELPVKLSPGLTVGVKGSPRLPNSELVHLHRKEASVCRAPSTSDYFSPPKGLVQRPSIPEKPADSSQILEAYEKGSKSKFLRLRKELGKSKRINKAGLTASGP